MPLVMYMPGHDPLHKVTIIPRGRALGLTMSLPEKDRYGFSRRELTSRIAMMFGGRIAEELIFGEENVTTGASQDIRQASATARRMVTEWGMSDKLGRIRYSENEEEVFLGHSVTQRKNVSDATARQIDEEIRRIIEEGETTAKNLLTEKLDELHALAKGLLEYETLSGEECRKIVKGEPITRDTSTDDMPRPTPRRSSIPPAGGARQGQADRRAGTRAAAQRLIRRRRFPMAGRRPVKSRPTAGLFPLRHEC